MKQQINPAAFFTLFMMFVSNIALSQDLIPLAVNNQWVFERTIIKPEGEVVKDTIVDRIGKSMMINEKEWYVFGESENGPKVRNTPEGYYELDSMETDAFGNFRQQMLYKNSEKSQTYKGGRGFIVCVSNRLHPVKSPVGNSDCYKYERRSVPYIPFYSEDIFISPGVGIVFREFVMESGLTVQFKLIDYELH